MEITKTNLKDCFVISFEVYKDKRGYFHETYHKKKYDCLLPKFKFVQDNLSFSKKNVIRGIHFQIKKPQGKLVRVVRGKVFDVAVDLRPNSKTFGEYFSIILSETNQYQIWIPPGFGHGFLSLENKTILEYKCTNFFDAKDEKCIIWNDKKINIKWPLKNKPVISQKDQRGVSFSSLNLINLK